MRKIHLDGQAIADFTVNTGAFGLVTGGYSTSNGSFGGATAFGTTNDGSHGLASGEYSSSFGFGGTSSGFKSASIGAFSNDDGVANVISVGNDTLKRRIVNVAPGTQATDAVNLDQLWQTNRAVMTAQTTADSALSTANQALSTANSAISYAAKGIAQAMAMPSVSIAPGATHGVAIAVGSYGSYQAVGFEYAKRTGNTQMGVGGAYTAGGELAMRASATFSW